MARRRESRDKILDIDLIKPLDILSLGGKEDACFGKHHDLKAPECMECGDSEFCAIVTAQNLKSERLSIESTQRFKDIEEADDDLENKKEAASKFIQLRKDDGLPRMKTILKVAKKFNLTKDIAKELYNQI